MAMQEGPPRKWPQRGERESQNTEHSLTTFRPHRNLRKNAPQIPAALHCKYTAESERFNPQRLITEYLCLAYTSESREDGYWGPSLPF